MSAPLHVLYEDNHLLCVEKPINVPVQQDDSHDEDLLNLCKAYVKQKYDKPGAVYLALVHRLDRPVGGVMVFARTSKAAERLQTAMKKGLWRKTYYAAVQGDAPAYAQLSDYLARDGVFARVASKNSKDAKYAQLSYERMAQKDGLSLLRIALHTGRHHQIRVQLASRGLPIWGDARYNKAAVPGEQIALHATALSFPHPVLDGEIDLYHQPTLPPFDRFDGALYQNGAVQILRDYGPFFAAYKPQGMETCGEDSLESRTGAVACHRLDVNTGGIVLLARDVDAQIEIENALRSHALRKTYECVVVGAPPRNEGELRAYLLKDAQTATVAVADAPQPGAKEIITRYKVLAKGAYSHLEIELVTGRTHQIRAHLSHIGCPVLGDDKYGNREANKKNGVKQQALFSTALGLTLGGVLAPYSGEVILSPPRFDAHTRALLEGAAP